MNEDPDQAFYLYGFAQPDFVEKAMGPPPSETASPSADSGRRSFWEAAGIEAGHPPFFRRCGATVAVLSVVSKAEFCGPAAESNLQDLAWVGSRAGKHQAVLHQVMLLAPAFPARFGTLFSSLGILDQFVEQHRETIERFLERVAGQEEWAVKGFLDRAGAEEELSQRRWAEQKVSLPSTPGLGYLQEQRLRLEVRQELEDWVSAASSALAAELAPLAAEACQRAVLSRAVAGSQPEMFLNWAFLVPSSRAAEFQSHIKQVGARQALPSLTFTVSGPWPPYSFCPSLEAAVG